MTTALNTLEPGAIYCIKPECTIMLYPQYYENFDVPKIYYFNTYLVYLGIKVWDTKQGPVREFMFLTKNGIKYCSTNSERLLSKLEKVI